MTKKSLILLGMVTLVFSGSLCSKAQSTNTFSLVNPPKQKLDYLPFGEIKPAGWMKTQMQNDLNGFVGHLDSLVPDLMADQIYGADRLTKSHKVKNLGNIGPELDPQYLWWNSETQSNWRDGFIRNAILLNDTAYLAKAQEYVDYILSTQDADGYLGIYSPDLRYRFNDENGELWAKATVLRGLMAWYEYTGKPEIMAAIVKAVDNVIINYPINASSPFKSSKPFAGGVTHGLMFTDILDRLYQLSGKKAYLDYALFLYKDFSLNILNEDAQYPKIINPAYKLKEHGAHTYEHLRPLVLAYYATGNPELKKAMDIFLKRISNCTTPSGGPIGDEWIGERHADATHTGYEYCSLHELMDGYISLLHKSGDAHFGDLTETLFFNAAQGARHPDKSAVAYCKTDNSYEMKGTRNGEIQKGENQTRYKYSPAHQDVAVCCAPNAGRIMPYYVKSMWMKDSEGLVSELQGPCEVKTGVKGAKVQITEETDYPFGNTINYKVSVEKPVSFVLKIRKPSWAKSFKLNCKFTEKDGYIVISKSWKGNEAIQLEFITEPEIKQDRNKENYFTYGALVFALPVVSKDSITKKYAVEGLNDYQYEPVNLQKYRLSSEEKPVITLKMIDNAGSEWQSLELNTTLVNEKTGKPENVKLLPLGATILRQVTFKNEVQTSAGTIWSFNNFPSEFVDARTIDVWLPDGYDSANKYNVVYMHDGQMLFDSTCTWNGKEWRVDETVSQLIKENKIEKCIVVGIWSNGKYRHSEYFPQKFLNTVSDDFKKEFVTTYLQDKPQSDNYLKFIVEELKPFIDKNFSTKPGKDNTFIMGSSMGGLISMYAVSEYPGVFYGAGCLSIAWVSMLKKNFELPLAGFNYLQKNAPSAFGHKIYMDHGTTEMDSMYGVYQNFVDIIMKEKGFNSANYKTAIYAGTGHNETDWANRLHIPFEFLLPKAPVQKASTGKIDKYEDFRSAYVAPRNVEVWLPDNYSADKKYAVLYMHDGQMLFDSTTTWNHMEWGVDEILGRLIKEKKIKECIVVGIWNTPKRHSEYFPQKPFELLNSTEKDIVTKQLQSAGRTTEVFQPVSDNYLKFIVDELKPFIDKTYSTYTDRNNTFIAGSSMGGLISMYAICEYPGIFGGAACLSTHWPGTFSMDNNPIPNAFIHYMETHLPDPKTHKIYFDYGDQTLDALYPPLQKQVDEVMKATGFTGKSWTTQYFPGKDHSEKSWNERLEIPILFLLKK